MDGIKNKMLGDVLSWAGNVSTSVLIVFVNKIVMKTTGYGFHYGAYDPPATATEKVAFCFSSMASVGIHDLQILILGCYSYNADRVSLLGVLDKYMGHTRAGIYQENDNA